MSSVSPLTYRELETVEARSLPPARYNVVNLLARRRGQDGGLILRGVNDQNLVSRQSVVFSKQGNVHMIFASLNVHETSKHPLKTPHKDLEKKTPEAQHAKKKRMPRQPASTLCSRVPRFGILHCHRLLLVYIKVYLLGGTAIYWWPRKSRASERAIYKCDKSNNNNNNNNNGLL